MRMKRKDTQLLVESWRRLINENKDEESSKWYSNFIEAANELPSYSDPIKYLQQLGIGPEELQFGVPGDSNKGKSLDSITDTMMHHAKNAMTKETLQQDLAKNYEKVCKSKAEIRVCEFVEAIKFLLEEGVLSLEHYGQGKADPKKEDKNKIYVLFASGRKIFPGKVLCRINNKFFVLHKPKGDVGKVDYDKISASKEEDKKREAEFEKQRKRGEELAGDRRRKDNLYKNRRI